MRYTLTLIIAFVVVAGWWLESRFGPTAALAVIGSIVGAALVISGLLVGLAHQRTTLEAATRFHEGVTGVNRGRVGVDREHARLERAYTEARLRLDQIDARRVDQIAQRRAQLIAPPAEPRRPTWADDDEDAPNAGASYQIYE